MIRRALPAVVALVALGALVAALAFWDRDEGGARNVETGVVVAVDAEGLVDVRGFTLRTNDGRTLDFRIGQLENAVQFPPSHLSVHMADSFPVRVTFVMAGSDRFAIRLEDAPPSG